MKESILQAEGKALDGGGTSLDSRLRGNDKVTSTPKKYALEKSTYKCKVYPR